MGIVLLAEAFITNKDINECLDQFEKLRRNTVEKLVVKASQQMIDIDILLIGYFILFKQESPLLEIELHLPFNKSLSRVGSLDIKLPQFATYAYLMNGKPVFTIYYQDDTRTWEPQKDGRFEEEHFAISRYFMLVCLISQKNNRLYESLFEKPLARHFIEQKWSLQKGVQGAIFAEDSEKCLSNYRKQILETTIPQRHDEAVVQLGRLAFFRSLHEAKILHFYTDPRNQGDGGSRFENMRAGNLSHRQSPKGKIYDAYRYYESVKSIFDSLQNQPLLFQFIFCTLLSSDLLPGSLKRGEEKQFRERLLKLYNFTHDLVHGLTELAKNVCEHTESKLGFISARLYVKEKFDILHQQASRENSIYSDHLNSLLETGEGSPEAILDIHVVDLGSPGIVPQLIRDCRDYCADPASDNGLKKMLEADISILNQEGLGLQQLLSLDGSFILSHQVKRSIAHLGLLTFSNLIHNNKGLFLVVSGDKTGGREKAVIENIELTAYLPAALGTCFTIVVPVFPQTGLRGHLPRQDLMVPARSSEQQIEGMEKLLGYVHHRIGIDREESLREISHTVTPVLLDYRVPQTDLMDKDGERLLWNQVKQTIESVVQMAAIAERCVVNLDLEDLNLDESHLFRLISKWGIHFPGISLLLSNLTSEAFLQMGFVNRLYMKKFANMPFWNSQMAIFLYHYIPVGEGQRFYFTDSLFGQNEEDHHRLNNLINKNQFNATTILKGLRPDRGGAWNLALPAANDMVVYKKKSLLPFDLLLRAENGLSIFENNAVIILQNDMQRKITTND